MKKTKIKFPKTEVKFKVTKGDFMKITSIENCAKTLHSYFETLETHVENFVAMFLNAANEVIAVNHMGKGNTTGVIVDVRNIAMNALNTPTCTKVIISHNHPSGSLMASNADIQMTEKVKTALKYFDIELLDHIILGTDGNYFSFANDGQI